MKGQKNYCPWCCTDVYWSGDEPKGYKGEHCDMCGCTQIIDDPDEEHDDDEDEDF